jgi:hypothetical protein
VKWPGPHENFVTNQHFALVRTDLEFLGQNSGDFGYVTGGSITVTGKALEIPYKLEPGSSDLEMSIAGHRLRLLFDHPMLASSSKSGIWRAISSVINRKVVKAIALGGFPIYMSQRIYFLLVAPHHDDASAYIRVGTGYILYPADQKDRVEALFAGNVFPTETVRVF